MSEVRNMPRLNQTVLYNHLITDGKLKPMDIDGVLDYHGKGWLIFEYKLNDANVSTGQGIALRRLADDLAKSKPVLLFILKHDVIDANNPIYAEDCIVKCHYCNGKYEYEKYQARVVRFGDVYQKALDWIDIEANRNQ
ncbi:MAG: hypothetical protein Q4A04_08270 [Eubacteriales bacterium]|nr:hypothetical protein [Eubacteriales bacterium]